MAQLAGSDEIESLRIELVDIGRSIRSSFSSHASSFRSISNIYPAQDVDGHKVDELQWAAIERLPTFERITSALFDVYDGMETGGEVKGKQVVNVSKLGAHERHMFIERIIKHAENDNLRLLQKLRKRIDKVGIKLPTAEVRYQNLCVEAECQVVHGKPVPTLWNTLRDIIFDITKLSALKSQKSKLSIINDANGIIKPGRMTLLLGAPASGKITLLMELAGKLSHSLKVNGDISYNGHTLDEFIPQKSLAYISQHDLHIPKMTVSETLDFSARCQGVGCRAELMLEVSRKEKEVGIVPNPDLNAYMKATPIKGLTSTLQTNNILKILGDAAHIDHVALTFMERYDHRKP